VSTCAWPRVLAWLEATLPTLPAWVGVPVYDTDVVTGDVPLRYAVVGRTSPDDVSGNFVRQPDPSGLVVEAGTVRLHIVTRTGDVDPAAMRSQGFALLEPLEAVIGLDQTLGGVLGQLGQVDLTVDVNSESTEGGTAQSLVVSVNYSTLI